MGKDSAFLANKKSHPLSKAKNYIENDINTITCRTAGNVIYIYRSIDGEDQSSAFLIR